MQDSLGSDDLTRLLHDVRDVLVALLCVDAVDAVGVRTDGAVDGLKHPGTLTVQLHQAENGGRQAGKERRQRVDVTAAYRRRHRKSATILFATADAPDVVKPVGLDGPAAPFVAMTEHKSPIGYGDEGRASTHRITPQCGLESRAPRGAARALRGSRPRGSGTRVCPQIGRASCREREVTARA